MVLKQLWPTAYTKTIDESDPANVWSSNIDRFTDQQLERGLRALRSDPRKFMPNAAQVAVIIKEANPPTLQADPVPTQKLDELYCFGSKVYQRYAARIFWNGSKITIHDVTRWSINCLHDCRTTIEEFRPHIVPEERHTMLGAMAAALVKKYAHRIIEDAAAHAAETDSLLFHLREIEKAVIGPIDRELGIE